MGYTSVFEMMEEYFPLKERIGNDDVYSEKDEKNKEIEKEKASAENSTDKVHINGTATDSENTVMKSKTASWADVVRAAK